MCYWLPALESLPGGAGNGKPVGCSDMTGTHKGGPRRRMVLDTLQQNGSSFFQLAIRPHGGSSFRPETESVTFACSGQRWQAYLAPRGFSLRQAA